MNIHTLDMMILNKLAYFFQEFFNYSHVNI